MNRASTNTFLFDMVSTKLVLLQLCCTYAALGFIPERSSNKMIEEIGLLRNGTDAASEAIE